MIFINEIINDVVVTVDDVSNAISLSINDNSNQVNIAISEIGMQGANGLSAYQIALNNGFVGTEATWLLSLKGSGIQVLNEVPNGVKNGVNTTFISKSNFIPESLQVYLNGMLQIIVSDYQTIGSNTIILSTSPNFSENILINYTKL